MKSKGNCIMPYGKIAKVIGVGIIASLLYKKIKR